MKVKKKVYCPRTQHNLLDLGSVSRKSRNVLGPRKATFSSCVSKNGEMYLLETSCMKGNFVNIDNM